MKFCKVFIIPFIKRQFVKVLVPLSRVCKTRFYYFCLLSDKEGLRDFQCNHVRAIYLFISSIRNTKCDLLGAICKSWDDYVAGKCGACKNAKDGNCIPLGMQVDLYSSMIKKDQSINVFLNTTAAEPFCLY